MSIATFVKRLATQGIELYPNGKQLGCRAPEGALTSELIGQLRTHKQDLLEYFDTVESHPPSYTQKGIWFELQLEPENTNYNITHMIRLYSVVDVALLQQTFQMLVNRHSILRTTITERDGELLLQLHHYQSVDFTQVDASRWSWEMMQEQVEAYHEQLFDLSERSFRVFLFTKKPDEHLLLIKMHHLFLDGRSISIMHAELRELYLAAKSQRVATLPAVETTFTDYVAWQQEMLEEQGEQLRTYWCNQLDDVLPILNLPTDRPYQNTYRQKTEKHTFEIATDLLQSLRRLARQEGVTLSTLLLAGYHILLHRYSGQDDILVGSIMAGRSREEFEAVLGYFLSPVVMRAKFTNDLTVQTFLQQFNQTIIGALNHQDYPLPLLVEALNPPHIPGRPPLYQAVFNMQRMPPEQYDNRDDQTANQTLAMKPTQNWDGLRLSSFTGIQNEEPLDLTLHVTDFTHKLQLTFSYHPDLFDATTIQRIASHFAVLLNSIVSHPDKPVQQLPMLTDAEYHQIVHQWNECAASAARKRAGGTVRGTAVDFGEPLGTIPLGQTIHALFEQQVERTPDAIALVFAPTGHDKDQQLTYAQLNARANQLAHYLIELGVQADTLVAVAMERSLEMIISLLAVLKAGGAYVPIDPSYPRERIRYMLTDCAAPILLTQSHLESFDKLRTSLSYDTGHVIAVDRVGAIYAQSTLNPREQTLPSDLAYVIYTSGSTGQPKGVLIEHGGAFNVATAQAELLPDLREGSRLLQLASLGFDAATAEIMMALMHGATLVIAPAHHERLGQPLYDLLLAQRITHVTLVPSVLRTLPAAELPDLTVLITAGEACPNQLVNRWAGGRAFFNFYGPTESPIWTTYAALQPGEAVHIGQPIPNRRVYILDDCGAVVPIGVAGELVIGGDGLARGYLNRPELTAERFIEHPQFGRLYKTGDLCRWLPDTQGAGSGNIEFMGRTDFQVKIRGFRIELGEIENALRACDGVREAVVLAREDNALRDDKRLVAYLIGDADGDVLRQQLAQRLPDYMVPSAFVELEAMPLTPNGKLDRRALPAPDYASASISFVAPRNALEQQLADIWAGVLGVEQVGIHDDFFVLGGHSLLATQVISRVRAQLNLEVPLKTLFEASQLAAFARTISQAQESTTAIIPKTKRDSQLPLSFAQQRLWFLDQLEPDSALYNMPMMIRLQGQLDVVALEQSFTYLIARHESLRTTFDTVDGEPIQIIHPPAAFTLSVMAVSSQQEAQKRGQEEASTPFNLSQGPLLRVQLLKYADDDHFLLLTMHHIISDGWSMGVLVEELSHTYTLYAEGYSPALPELPIQYADFAVWQREYLSGDVLDRQLSFWREQLTGAPAQLTLPTDRPRPLVQSYRGAHYTFHLNGGLTAKLNQLAQTHEATLFMVLLAGFNLLLSRYSRQTDIVVGTPIANRNRAEIEGLIGFFVNTLILRTQLDDNPSFTELLARVRQTTLAAYEHQDLPFEQLVDELELERYLNVNPLFQVMFVLQNAEIKPFALPGIHATPHLPEFPFAKFDLTLTLIPSDDGLMGALEYSTDLFDESTIKRMASHFEVLLNSIVALPDKPVLQLPMLTEAEYHQIVHEWNGTTVDFGEPQTIQALFEQQAKHTPNAVALIFEDAQLTYAELNARANQLAHYLRENGVQTESPVGVCLNRHFDLIISILAIIKAGGAYVPLDPTYPLERLQFMVRDTGLRLILTEADLIERVPLDPQLVDVKRLDLRHYLPVSPEINITTDNLLYIMYTSGSTGQPKGIEILHRNVQRLIKGANFARLDATQTFLQLASPSFDAATFEIWGSLCNGARLVLYPEKVIDLQVVGQLIQTHQISILWLTAGLFHQMVDYHLEALSGVGQLLAGGDVLSVPHVSRLLKSSPKELTLINGYGPTENTTFTTTYRITDIGPQARSVPIGVPISNTQTFILDEGHHLTAIGVPGELYTGGLGVARGYLNRPQLTAERFIEHPQFGRLYKTGDLCRWLPDGNIEFIGRTDFQVKIRGFRIELGEIESALLAQDGVREAVVLAREGNAVRGDKRLVAYIVIEDGLVGDTDTNALRQQLVQHLPDYMVPTAFVELDAMPLTPNGKLDRRALPAPDYASRQTEFVAPRTDIEKTLALVWANVLGLERVGIEDDFFALGGDSLLSLRVVAKVKQAGIQLTAKEIFLHKTILKIAASTTADLHTSLNQTLEPSSGSVPLTPSQCQFFDWNPTEINYYNIASLFEVPADLNPVLLEKALYLLQARHDALQLRFARTETGWQQFIAKTQPQNVFNLVDFTKWPKPKWRSQIETAVAKFQRSLDLLNGPLFRVVLFDFGTQDPNRLLILTHHLINDGISMGILISDLYHIYHQLSHEQEIRLTPIPTSFQKWANELMKYAQSDDLKNEYAYWLAVCQSQITPLPVDYPENGSTYSCITVRHYSAEPLSVIDTNLLIQKLTYIHDTTIENIMLTALARTLNKWTKHQAFRIDLVRHGRNEFIGGCDLSLTVGWFADFFPVQLDIQGTTTFDEALQLITTYCQNIPNKGLGYGLLRYLCQNNEIPKPIKTFPRTEVLFNYVGEFNLSSSDMPLFQPAKESIGHAHSQQASQRHRLEITAWVMNGQFHMDWEYNELIHRSSTIEYLSQTYMNEMRSFIYQHSLHAFGQI